jgi:hypothetical protein
MFCYYWKMKNKLVSLKVKIVSFTNFELASNMHTIQFYFMLSSE